MNRLSVKWMLGLIGAAGLIGFIGLIGSVGAMPTTRPALKIADASAIAAFRALCAERHASAEKSESLVVRGPGDELHLSSDLRHLSVGPFWGESAVKVSAANKPAFADPLPAIIDFKEQLEKAGVSLILLPVPVKASLPAYPLADGFQADGRIDAAQVEFHEILREKGITVIDLVPRYVDQKTPVYCRQDSHWSGHGLNLAAEAVAEAIKAQPWYANHPRQVFDHESRDIEIVGDLWKALKDEGLAKEKLALRFVGKKAGAAIEPIPSDPDSPVVLLGDSHTLVFHLGEDLHAKGAGLADQLALELGFAVDVIGVRGSGATPARFNFMRKIRGNAGYLQNKKVVIWCFATREFTESSGWQKVPLLP